MANKYELYTLADIAQIPTDRLDAFFTDLKAWIDVQKTLLDGINEDLITIDGMRWTDDGIVGLSNIELNGEVVWSAK